MKGEQEKLRERQQGQGKPIITAAVGERRIVAVGNTILHSEKWKTFEDFLFTYLKMKLGTEWGNAELAKPLAERHTILQWYDEVARLQLDCIALPGEITATPATGGVICYLGLAYNLYILDHNSELQERFLSRVRDPKNFQGAYYELIVASILIRAGFTLVLEDEADLNSKHCEFSAVSRTTGKKYWVEAKMRAVEGLFGKTAQDGVRGTERDATGNMTAHIKAALLKPAEDERLIFVDLNAEVHDVDGVPDWGPMAVRRLEAKERDLQEGQTAYVFVTNLPFHRYISSTAFNRQALAYGLGMPDFSKPARRTLIETYKLKQKHIDAHEVMDGLQSYPVFPDTFEGGLRSDASNRNIKIGETYLFTDLGEPPGTVGTVTTAVVNEAEAKAMVAISTPDGKNLIIAQPMSADQIADYKRHPDLFFGEESRNGGNIDDPYLLFEWMLKSYSKTPKERLLEFMVGSSDIDRLKLMTQEDLALIYCERMVFNFLSSHAPEKLNQPGDDPFRYTRKLRPR
ncbi:hypothetical protein WNZ14_05770 [Hoeflea sp. AS60]|uniref:hypothetical protein n=1 Tax=Hoeflea sp. AS60 TaxID=3135780 RepID=UPI00317096F4